MDLLYEIAVPEDGQRTFPPFRRRAILVIVLSHWPHVATQVAAQVAGLVAELVFAM